MPQIYFFLILFFFFLQPQNTHAACYKVALLGDSGKVIKPGGLVTAMRIGRENIFVDILPIHRDKKIVGPVDCPKHIYDAILNLYNSSCTSDTSINQMVENTGSNRKAVVNRCAEMKYALTLTNF